MLAESRHALILTLLKPLVGGPSKSQAPIPDNLDKHLVARDLLGRGLSARVPLTSNSTIVTAIQHYREHDIGQAEADY